MKKWRRKKERKIETEKRGEGTTQRIREGRQGGREMCLVLVINMHKNYVYTHTHCCLLNICC